jgi:demethoxyubiquinone hydroxylase (CLK1/Coq7/Cat5 family)
MTDGKIEEELRALVQLDLDAIAAYGLAMQGVDVLALRSALGEMRLDHLRHVDALATALEARGTTPPAGPDAKGALLGGMTALRSLAGTEGALAALRDDERTTTGRYARALTLPWPEDLLVLVRRFHADEQRHLETLERWLDDRPWESAGARV